MKRHIREMIDEMRKKHHKDYVPPSEQALPDDLENQILSRNKLERTRQLDFQAQQSEEEQTIG